MKLPATLALCFGLLMTSCGDDSDSGSTGGSDDGDPGGAAAVRQITACGGRAIIHYGRNRNAAEALAAEVGADKVHLCAADLLSTEATETLWDQACAWRGRIGDVLAWLGLVFAAGSLLAALGTRRPPTPRAATSADR